MYMSLMRRRKKGKASARAMATIGRGGTLLASLRWVLGVKASTVTHRPRSVVASISPRREMHRLIRAAVGRSQVEEVRRSSRKEPLTSIRASNAVLTSLPSSLCVRNSLALCNSLRISSTWNMWSSGVLKIWVAKSSSWLFCQWRTPRYLGLISGWERDFTS